MRTRRLLGRYWLDGVFIAAPGAGAVACWAYSLPTWMLVFCLVGLAFGFVSLLGDLGVFHRLDDEDD